MDCNKEHVSSYRDNLLAPAERAAFEDHMAGCPSCQRTLAAYVSVGEAIRALPMTAAPDTLRRSVMTLAPRRAQRARPSWLPAASGFAGASLAVALALVLFIQLRGANQAAFDSQTAAGAMEARQSAPPTALAAEAPSTMSGFAPTTSPTAPASTPTNTPPTAVPPTRVPAAIPPAPTPFVERSTATAVPDQPTATPEPATPTTAPSTPTSAPATPTTAAAPVVPTPAVPTPAVPTPIIAKAPAVPTVCAAPAGRIGRAYQNDEDLRDELGCPVGGELVAAAQEVSFQRGRMIRVAETNRMYVIINGNWLSYVDEPPASRGALSVAPGEPPEPFLRSYRDRAGLRQALGTATGEVRSYTMPVQSFERGIVLGADNQTLYVLYSDGSWEQKTGS